MNSVWKRILALIMAAFLLVSCSPSNDTKESSSSVAESTMESTMESTTESTTVEATTAAPEKTEQSTESGAKASIKDLVKQGAEQMGLEVDHEEELKYANKFTLTHYKDGYKIFTTSNDDKKMFLLVPEGKPVPENVPENTYVLQQPITKIHLVTSSMAGYFDKIGALDTVVTTGTAANKWYIEEMKNRVESGKIKFAGKYSEPDFETLTNIGIELEIDTTMLNSKPEIMQKYEELGIPVVVETSSKENHPLGRVEWIKLIGSIVGKEEEAAAFFDDAAKKVENVIAQEKTNKTVAMFFFSTKSGMVYARNGGDYMAKMIEMAGGNYIMSDVEPNKSGLTKLNYEEIYAKCIDADYIFYINYGDRMESLEDMFAVSELFKEFKAVKENRVYITVPSYSQDIVRVADIIEDMNTVLKDETVEKTSILTKLH